MALAVSPLLPRLALRRLTARERLAVAAGAAALLIFLLWAVLRGDAEEPAVELASPPAPAIALAPPLPASPAPVPSASAAGLVLRGVMGRGAILRLADGSERAIPIGREFLPGLTLKAVGVDHAILASSGGDLRIELNRFGAAAPAASAVATAVAPQAPPPSAERHRIETAAFRIGMQARKRGPNIVGYAIRPGARLPLFERAGLRPGDVVVAVNGQALDGEERLFGLSGELAGAPVAEIEYERGGRRMKAAATVNQ